MPSSLETVTAYLDAIAQRDFVRARSYLADAGFEYIGPINSFSSPDDFMNYMALTTPIVQRIEILKSFVDGNDVLHILLFTTQLSERRTSTVVMWAGLESGKIRRLEAVFDAYEYKKLFVTDDD